MQVTTTKLLRLLQPGQPREVRCAVVLVLGELGGKDAEVTKALCEGLQDEDPALRLQVIQAVGKLRVEQALPHLLARVKEGGDEAEQAALAAARLGPKGARALQELMPKVAPGLRRHVAAALAAGGTASAGSAAVAVLLDRDPGVIEATVRSLIGQVPTLGAAQRHALTDQLLHLLGEKNAALAAASESAVVRLLAALDDPRAEAALWDRVMPPHPPEVRAAGLQALGKWVTAPDKEQLRRLMSCAADPDFRVAAPAVMILKHLPVTEKALPEWLSLLQAPDVAVRQAAMEKLGDRENAALAEALLGQLTHPDRALRDAALARLARTAHGRKALTEALLGEGSEERAWLLARAQVPFVKEYPSSWREEVFTRASASLEAGERRAEPLLFLLGAADAAELRDRLEQRALSWREKEEYATALLYLRRLTRDPACGLPIRLELAACGLKVSGHDLAADARDGDPCLHQFTTLCQQYGDELYEHLEKAKWLEAEDLYYLGFHLAEQGGALKAFAAKVLQLLVKRAPRSKLGKAAKSKLHSEGLG
jgi:HEAT repeat protein